MRWSLGLLLGWLSASASAAPLGARYAGDLAAGTPQTVNQVVAAAQQDLAAVAAVGQATLDREGRDPAHLSQAGREAMVALATWRTPSAADTVAPWFTTEFVDLLWPFHRTVLERHPAASVLAEVGSPALPTLDRLAGASDSDASLQLSGLLYTHVLNRHGLNAARVRLKRLVSASANPAVRDRYRAVGRGIPARDYANGSIVGRWDKRMETLVGSRATPPVAMERNRYTATQALLTALPAWLDDPAQHFRAVAALRILAILRSPEPADLLCERLTWVDDGAKPDAPLTERYPMAAGLIAIGHLMFDPLTKKLGASDDPLEQQLGALVLDKVLDGREEARAFLLDESQEAKRYEWGKDPKIERLPSARLKALAESDWLKGDDPPLVVQPLVVQP